jgi:death on curing protein
VSEVEFVTWDELLVLHEDQLRRYGGQNGFIDEGVVRSVMSRSQFTSQYSPDADLADLAADYMYGFSTTQGFLDGNKRTALVTALFFMRKNGCNVFLSEKLMYFVALAVAKGDLDRDGLAEILRTHMEPLDDSDAP